MIQETDRNVLMNTVRTAAEFCLAVERAGETGKREFVGIATRYLAELYLDFSFPEYVVKIDLDEEADFGVSFSYVDENFYNRVRSGLQSLFGEDDVYLEAFHEDMKYSDTPVAASISEGLADIFQDLYNFISVVQDTEGDRLEEAYGKCRENFNSYWGQVTCNLMRPLHYLIINSVEE